MLYSVIAYDKNDHLQKRLSLREGHLEFLSSCDKLKLAGPFLNDKEEPVGSLLVFDVETKEELEAILQQDPYAKADLFKSVTISPWRLTENRLG